MWLYANVEILWIKPKFIFGWSGSWCMNHAAYRASYSWGLNQGGICSKPSQSIVATPLWGKCEVATHTPENGNLESFGTPENSDDDCRGQNTLHWGVFYTVGKLLKFRCLKWPRMSHLDIHSPTYGRMKGRESNWQFDFRPLKVGNRPAPHMRWGSAIWRWKALDENYNIGLDLVQIGGWGEKLWPSKVPEVQTETISGLHFGSPGTKKPFRCSLRGVTQSILYGGGWWLPPSPSRGESSESKVARGLSQHQKDAEWVLTTLWLVLDARPNN